MNKYQMTQEELNHCYDPETARGLALRLLKERDEAGVSNVFAIHDNIVEAEYWAFVDAMEMAERAAGWDATP